MSSELQVSLDRHLVEVLQEEFGHCSVHGLDQVQQLCASRAHFHSEEGSANHRRKEKCTFFHAGADCVRENKGQVSPTLSSQRYNRPSVSVLNSGTFQRKHKIQARQQRAGLLLFLSFYWGKKTSGWDCGPFKVFNPSNSLTWPGVFI